MLAQIKDQVAKKHEFDSWLNMYQNTTDEEFFIYEDEAIMEYNVQLLQQKKELREALEEAIDIIYEETHHIVKHHLKETLSKHPNK